jgi:hypothetical protein
VFGVQQMAYAVDKSQMIMLRNNMVSKCGIPEFEVRVVYSGYCFVLHCTAVYCFVLNCTALLGTAWLRGCSCNNMVSNCGIPEFEVRVTSCNTFSAASHQ